MIAAHLLFALVLPAIAQDQDAGMQNFRQADVNEGAALDHDEFVTFIDLNAEGNIGRAGMIKKRDLYSMAFQRLDTNGDGTISAAELSQIHVSSSSVRGVRYCEILLVYGGCDSDASAEVWGTQGVNLCPDEDWRALDSDAIRSAFGATEIVMNGPRFMAYDAGSSMDLSNADHRLYGKIGMRRLATLQLGDGGFGDGAYQTRSVLRANTWAFSAGSEIYELTDPDGAVYVMQAWSQNVNPELQEADLANLGSKLNLPDGWSFSTQVLSQDLKLVANGEAVVVQDELQNTYQRR